MEISFTYANLWSHPLGLIAFFTLAMSGLSLWIKKTVWLWGAFLGIALFTAFTAQLITSSALIPLALLGVGHWIMRFPIQRWWRLFFFVIITVISIGLLFHQFSSFHNWHISPTPYSLWLNFDKPFIGLWPLIASIPLLQTQEEWRKMGKASLPLILISLILLTMSALLTHLIQWDPKLPAIFPLWALVNLVFVCIPEEAFFRGFLQREFNQWLGGGTFASVAAIFAVAIAFTFAHVYWVPSVHFLFLVFIAGVIYGTIYTLTQSIEASIACHWLVNLIHFLFFSSPP